MHSLKNIYYDLLLKIIYLLLYLYTNHCTFVAKEVISYYINSGSDVYACALDMQKAFDRVDLVKFFRKLLQRPISALIVRILFHLYFNIKLRVLWNNVYSSEFLSLNGVKQGGILSPYLFRTFINDFILELEQNRQGCFIGHMFHGCIVYADDILLLAPSLHALCHMLNICSIFADDNNIRFNQAKSHCLHFCKFNTAIKQYPVELQGTALTWTDHIAHLGHILCSSLDDSMDIDKRKRDFCSQANYFFTHFHHLSPALKSGLFQTYCQLFYGSQIWNLQNAVIESFNVAWRKAIRKLWGVPYRTHCNLLHHLMFGKNVVNILHSHFITFACSCLSSHNFKISFVAHNASVS